MGEDMIKALLIITALGGGVNHTTEMPNMKSCLDARVTIMKQDPDAKVLCIPKEDDTLKIRNMFEIFMDLIDQMKEYEEIDRLNREEDCKRPFGALECEG
jgi:hypothetical protein